MSGISGVARLGKRVGHMQAVADNGTYNRMQTAYRAYIDHATACEAAAWRERCATADQAVAEYRQPLVTPVPARRVPDRFNPRPSRTP